MHKPPLNLPGVPLRLTRRESLIAEALWAYFLSVYARPFSPGLLRGILLGEAAALARLGLLDSAVDLPQLPESGGPDRA